MTGASGIAIFLPVGLIGGSDAQKRYCIGGGTVAVSGLSALLFARGRQAEERRDRNIIAAALQRPISY